ncbi:P-loop containing nucleoside triphosphate hydrolase protein [Mycena polygramma]|nr:P-loop containing nucleoside triphosphate hydrolase protein [Mycena polygramma]
MAPRYRWSDPQGLSTLKIIVKKEISQWKDGLYPEQENIVIRVLDGQDILCGMTTGAGKSGMFAVPIIVLREMARNRQLYPDLPIRELPMGIVVTPTKGLAANIVHELSKLGVPAFAYCHETVTDARKSGRNLVEEIRQCKTWSIICVDPEHLRDKSWRQITASDVFRANIVYGCVDEAHLIKHWGVSFRPFFRHIGAFFRGRLPSSASILALSATFEPGAATNSICQSLGLSGDNFYLLRCSNERPNTQFIMEPLKSGLGGKEFPALIPYLNSGRKAVLHCRRIDDVSRVFTYLWNSLPPGLHRLRRIQMYHSLRSFEDNAEILRLLDEDPECQVVIATVAFANGLNVKSLLDSISLGFPDTVDQLWQEKGRVGRDPETTARGIVLYQPSVLKQAQKQLSDAPATTVTTSKPTKSKRKPVKPMEHSKALVLVEKRCYTAVINRIYRNPPIETSTLDCIAAKRRVPCSLCAARVKKTLTFLPSPLPPGLVLPPFTPPTVTRSVPLSAAAKKLKLKRKERTQAEAMLVAFGETVRRAEHRRKSNRHRPKSSYFPTSILQSVLDALLAVNSPAALTAVVSSWIFAVRHLDALYDVVKEIQVDITADREEARLAKNAKAQKKRQAEKGHPDSDSVEDEMEDGMVSEAESNTEDERASHPRSSPVPPPAKRTRTTGALAEVTNKVRPARRIPAPRQKQLDAATISAGFRPEYRTSRRRAAKD